MKLFKQLRLIGRWTLLSAIVMLCRTDVEVDATSNKETSLVNLAKDLTTVMDSKGSKGRSFENPKLLTDEDKYCLNHNNEGNKEKDSNVGKNALPSLTRGAEATMEYHYKTSATTNATMLVNVSLQEVEQPDIPFNLDTNTQPETENKTVMRSNKRLKNSKKAVDEEEKEAYETPVVEWKWADMDHYRWIEI